MIITFYITSKNIFQSAIPACRPRSRPRAGQAGALRDKKRLKSGEFLDIKFLWNLIRLRRRPRLRAETPEHFGVQAQPMAVDECEEDNPAEPYA
jgi:hypothetical protein